MNLSTDDSKQKLFMELYTPCKQPFLKYCRGITSNLDDARDLAGDSILVVFENLDKLRKRDSFKAYLFGVARRLRLNQHRRKKFQGEYNEGEANGIQSQQSPPDLNPDVELLYAYLEKLPVKQKEAFLLFELSGFSLKEIKLLQGGSLAAVKSRLNKARVQLRLWFNDEDGLLESRGKEDES